MTEVLTLNYKQAVSIINQMDDFEKNRLADYINALTFPQWLTDFRERMKDIPVSFDEVTKMVEEVRKESYENSH